ncbi:Doa10 [Intoshia linei]|uniref:RING-type E3 ubiquitin transferase n=1 Tax=Intoshia linei TaxID=1819745 RepID=A0A177BAP4_9BILA|nr:Doa10 [Intoshia linei]
MSNTELDLCRVCRDSESSINPFSSPCLCTGTQAYIHEYCLQKWISIKKINNCEICGHEFVFKSVLESQYFKWYLTYISAPFDYSVGRWQILVKYFASFSIIVNLFMMKILFYIEEFYLHLLYGTLVFMFIIIIIIDSRALYDTLLHDNGPTWFNLKYVGDTVINTNNENGVPVFNDDNVNVADFANPIVDSSEEFDDSASNSSTGEADLQADVENPETDNPNNNPAVFDGRNIFRTPLNDLYWQNLMDINPDFSFLRIAPVIFAMILIFNYLLFYLPIKIGHFVMHSYVSNEVTFKSIVFIYTGYIVYMSIAYIFYELLYRLKVYKYGYFFGFAHFTIKLIVLVVYTMMVFPALIGFWIDICSLKLMNTKLSIRFVEYNQAPMLFLFSRFIVGCSWIVYFNSFIIYMKLICKESALSMIAKFKAASVKEWYSLGWKSLIRCTFGSVFLNGMATIIVIWLPTKFTITFLPGLIPFKVDGFITHYFASDLIIAITICSPLIKVRILRNFLRLTLILIVHFASSAVGVRDYFLGKRSFANYMVLNLRLDMNNNFWDNPDTDEIFESEDDKVENTHISFKFYRIIGFWILFCFTLFILSLIIIITPLLLGRSILNKKNDFTAYFVGFVVIIICKIILLKTILYLFEWKKNDTSVSLSNFLKMTKSLLSLSILFFLMLYIYPYILGLNLYYFVIRVVIPFNVCSRYVNFYLRILGLFSFKLILIKITLFSNMVIRQHILEILFQPINRLDLFKALRHVCLPLMIWPVSTLVIRKAIVVLLFYMQPELMKYKPKYIYTPEILISVYLLIPHKPKSCFCTQNYK